MRGGGVGVLIVVLGVVGIAVALGAIVEVAVTAVRLRRAMDLALVLGAAALTVWLLIVYGDVLMQ